MHIIEGEIIFPRRDFLRINNTKSPQVAWTSYNHVQFYGSLFRYFVNKQCDEAVLHDVHTHSVKGVLFSTRICAYMQDAHVRQNIGNGLETVCSIS